MLSVIIPYYNTYELTKELLNTLCSQKTDDVEIILINDGSDAGRFIGYPITIINQANGGVSSARNKGLDIATGNFITFVDSDDMIKSNYISKIINKINMSVFDYCLFSWEAIGRIRREFIIYDEPLTWNTSVWNCIYKRETIGNNRFDETLKISEDTDFNNRVRKGKKENIIDILYVYNSGRLGSITSTYRQEIGNE